MRVIFLDIDGVLNTESFITHFWEYCRLNDMKRPEAKKEFNELIRDEYGNLFDPMAVNWLKYVIEQTGVTDIVISSSWRASGLQFMQDLWKHRGLCGNVIDITPYKAKNRLPKDLPFAERFERGYEIKEWIDSHDVESYVIFDDDNDMLPEQLPYFVQTNSVFGITSDNAIQAVNILTLL